MGRHVNTETQRASRKRENGEITQAEYNNILFRQYGFKDKRDYNNQLRITVLKIIFKNIGVVNSVCGNKHHKYYIYNKTKLRIEFINKYKNIYKDILIKCNCCGEIHEEFLTLDHKNNNGADHRCKTGYWGHLYEKMLDDGFDTNDYQILCLNCNSSLGFRGYCPHRPEIKREIPSEKILKKKKLRIELQKSTKPQSISINPISSNIECL